MLLNIQIVVEYFNCDGLFIKIVDNKTEDCATLKCSTSLIIYLENGNLKSGPKE